jgi:large subunit ribosomal protein L17
MRHRVKVNKLNRDTKHRRSLFKNLVRALIEHGAITTTEPKAKETKRLADQMIGKARQDSLATRRNLHEFFGKRDVVNTLVERIAPLFPDRISGFTTISVVGKRRGDNTQLYRLALVVQPEVTGTLKRPEAEKAVATEKRNAAKKTAPAKKSAVTKKATPAKKTVAKTK